MVVSTICFLFSSRNIKEDFLVDEHDVSHGLNNHQLDILSFLAGEKNNPQIDAGASAERS